MRHSSSSTERRMYHCHQRSETKIKKTQQPLVEKHILNDFFFGIVYTVQYIFQTYFTIANKVNGLFDKAAFIGSHSCEDVRSVVFPFKAIVGEPVTKTTQSPVFHTSGLFPCREFSSSWSNCCYLFIMYSTSFVPSMQKDIHCTLSSGNF